VGNFLYLCVFLFLSSTTPLPVKACYSTSYFVSAPLYIHTIFYPTRSSFLDIVLMSFSLIILLNIFFPISLRLSFTIFVTVLKLHSYCFVHTNANPILYSSSFNSTAQLLTFILLPFCHPYHCCNGPSISQHTIRYHYYTTCPLHFPLLLSLSSSISANPLAAQFSMNINFLQNLLL
jgi:hypothetical protein